MKIISVKDALEAKNSVIIDTRSPCEYELDHMPGAINIPILEDEERKIVGTLYKQNPEEAIALGHDYYNKKLPELSARLNEVGEGKKVIISCFRGGMRSTTVVELALKLGLDAVQLEKGYKNYRAYIREYLENYIPPFKFVVLQGLAGCGKTALLKEIDNMSGEVPTLDLEGLAQHRSSVFGAIGLKPRTQKSFETLLYVKLQSLAHEKLVFVEGESHKVGPVFIPNKLFRAMKKGYVVKINSSINTRVKQIVSDYFTHGEDEKIKEIIGTLRQHLTRESFTNIMTAMDEKDYETVSRTLLEEYYDVRYKFIVETMEYEYEVSNEDVVECAKELAKIREKMLTTE